MNDQQIKVIKYLDYLQEKENFNIEQGKKILSLMPKHLRDDVYIEFFGSFLQKSYPFRAGFSKELLEDLSLQMQEVLYGPGEVIYSKGEADDRIFFVVRGNVELFQELKNKRVIVQ